jgi:glycosyltransferase involved in cell wall biosynthesis
MTKPRICFVGPMLGRNQGWVVNPMEVLAPHLQSRGYECYTTSPIVNKYRRLIDIIYTVVRLRSKLDVLCIQVYSGKSFFIDDLVSHLGARFGLGIIMVLRGGAMPIFIGRHSKWIKRVLNRSHVLVTPSNYLARTVEKLGFNASIIPNAIDLKHYPFRLRRNLQPRLIWMRTFHEIYNPQMAVEVLDQLKNYYPNVHLTMAGQDKGLLRSVEDLTSRKSLNAHVSFAGFLDITGKQTEFANHDIYLNTNRVDNMPVSVIEAAAFGLPVVTTAVGGIPDFLSHERNAIFVESEDISGMTHAVRRLLNSPEISSNLSANGRQLARSYSFSTTLSEWESLFDQIVDQGI